MKALIPLIAFLTLLPACKQKQSHCPAYFQFDSVVHYQLALTAEEELSWMDKEPSTPEDTILNYVLVGDTLANLADTGVIPALEQIGYKQLLIDKQKAMAIKDIFCKADERDEFTTCLAVYRDILIFRQNNKIIGAAKICFDCGDLLISGPASREKKRSKWVNFYKLGKLLHPGDSTNTQQ